MKKETSEKKSEIKLKVFNVKLISKTRLGTDAYVELIEGLIKECPRVDVGSHRAIEFMRIGKDSDLNLYTGELIKYTILDEENWYNRKTNELQSYEIKDDIFPNSVKCNFFFVPEAHRFFYIDKSEFSDRQIDPFLHFSFYMVIIKSEELKIDIEVSHNVISEIINADIVSRLEINVSYTNNDLSEDYEEFVDKDLKDTGVNNINLVANSNKKSTLDLLKSKILKGYLLLSQKNGSAKATIKNEGKPRKKIITKDHPNRLSLNVRNEFIERDVYNEVMRIYRSSNNG